MECYHSFRLFNQSIFLNVDETTKDAEYKLAQSGDATCNGLDSAEVFMTQF